MGVDTDVWLKVIDRAALREALEVCWLRSYWVE